MTTHKLWTLSHPTEGIVFALAPSASEAWENGLRMLYGDDPGRDVYLDGEKRRLHARGWRAKRCVVEVSQ